MKFNKFIVSILSMIVIGCASNMLFAQRVGISTNVLGLATLSPNVGLEIVVGNKSTLSFDVSGAPWHISDKISLKHILISPEYKYWFTQAMYSHYVGANIMYAAYKARFNDKNYHGSLAAIGVTYGYNVVLGKRWNFIPSIGLGFGVKTDHIDHSTSLVPAITKFSASFQYIIR